jgi:hypothetical protein
MCHGLIRCYNALYVMDNFVTPATFALLKPALRNQFLFKFGLRTILKYRSSKGDEQRQRLFYLHSFSFILAIRDEQHHRMSKNDDTYHQLGA